MELRAGAEGCLEEQTLKQITRAINVKGQESASTSSFACFSELDCRFRCRCPLKGQEQRQISGILEEWAVDLDAGMMMDEMNGRDWKQESKTTSEAGSEAGFEGALMTESEMKSLAGIGGMDRLFGDERGDNQGGWKLRVLNLGMN
jgi:hypothetical protein